MAERATPAPAPRLRRRLTAAFVIVAAVSAGLVAVVTVAVTRENRWRSFRAVSTEEARFAAAVSPLTLDDESFADLRAVYERRGDANLMAAHRDATFSSAPALDLADVPATLQDVGDDPRLEETTIDGRSVLVAAIAGRGDARYFLFFSTEELRHELTELARVAVVAWLAVVVLAGAVGRIVARRTLRPVAVVAEAAEAIAAGDLAARLPIGGADEFGALAASFNHMADEVARSIAELAESAARERQLTADVAHELRTPLTAMSAAAQVLADERDTLPPDVAAAVAIVVDDVERFRHLTLTLLELAALDVSDQVAARGDVDVAEAVEQAMAIVDVPPHVPVRLDIPAGLHVSTDAARLDRVLGNLIDNAVRHGDGAPVEISARADDREVSIVVRDEGRGIPPDDLVRVFDRFFVSDRSRSAGGNGLGLAIAARHAEILGGTLSAQSEVGGWTRFELRIPATTEGRASSTQPAGGRSIAG